MNYEEAIEFIHSTEWQGSRPGLTRITELMDKLGNPQESLKIIHVAGTNGKGSFCAMLDSVLREAGYKTGLFTSPYIEFFEERIQVGGELIPKDELAEIVTEIAPHCLSMSDTPTEFEVLTAIGYSYFAKKMVDVAIVECGMGGRLDSTNVITSPVLSVITGISLDHVAFLGDTVEKIAAEKAGIIKAGRPVLYGGKEEAARKVIKARAKELGSLYKEKDPSAIHGVKTTKRGIRFNYKKYKNINLALLGSYQPDNCSNVIEAVELLNKNGFKITEKAMREGLSKAVWKGRFEKLCELPEVYFDGGHNEEGVTAAVDTVKRRFGKKKINVISGVLRDKDYEKIANEISSVSANVYTVTPNNPRALDAESYAKQFRKNSVLATPCKSYAEAVGKAFKQSAKDGRPLLCVGSLYSYPDFKSALSDVDPSGDIRRKAKERQMAKRMVSVVLILIAVFLAINLVFESGVLNRLFGEDIKYRDYPPIDDLYPIVPSFNIFEYEPYMEKLRGFTYTSEGVSQYLETDEEIKQRGEYAVFFDKYFTAVINGDTDTYNSLLSASYKKKKGEKDDFTMQMLYDMEVIYTDSYYLNENTPNQIAVYEFDVGYRIMMNNGTYRNNLHSDDRRDMKYVLYRYQSGEILIHNMTEYYLIID